MAMETPKLLHRTILGHGKACFLLKSSISATVLQHLSCNILQLLLEGPDWRVDKTLYFGEIVLEPYGLKFHFSLVPRNHLQKLIENH